MIFLINLLKSSISQYHLNSLHMSSKDLLMKARPMCSSNHRPHHIHMRQRGQIDKCHLLSINLPNQIRKVHPCSKCNIVTLDIYVFEIFEVYDYAICFCICDCIESVTRSLNFYVSDLITFY